VLLTAAGAIEEQRLLTVPRDLELDVARVAVDQLGAERGRGKRQRGGGEGDYEQTKMQEDSS
jgi:hypothetical protein